MQVTLNNVLVSSVSVKETTDKDESGNAFNSPKFVTVKIIDGDYTRTLWGFADSLTEVSKGDTINAVIYISAKNSKQGKAYLSLQLKEIHPVII
jgi:hypothetical protein